MTTQKKITKKILLEMADELGMKGTKKLKKTDLVHTIQISEGNSPCFLQIPNCSVQPCLYRAECQ